MGTKSYTTLASALLLTGCPGSDDATPFADAGTGGTAADTGIPVTSGVTDGADDGPPATSGGSTDSGGGSSGVADTGANTTDDGDSTTDGGMDDTDGGSSSDGPAPECTMDTECAPGNLCVEEMCTPGCNMMQPCAGADACCEGQCIDTDTSMEFCGSCETPCEDQDNQAASCELGMCVLGECDAGNYDCDGMGATGCESQQECACDPDEEQDCYPFAPGTEGIGPCQSGTQTCNAAGTAWGACTGFVGPQAEICDNGVDDDCNGAPDDFLDIDGDGWTVCDNDCCEDEFGCSDPELVNPGAFEFVGNGVDDDCDPATSDLVAAAACSVQTFGNVTGTQLANAMDICQSTTAGEPLPTRKWGLLNAQLLRADGSAPPVAQFNSMQDLQTAVMTAYGTGGIVPVEGPTMAGLSSGRMRDQNDPGYLVGNAESLGYLGNPPAGYLAANGGALPASAGCSGNCPSGVGANDSVNLRLTIRVPTNAQSFRYRLKFLSAEYTNYSCDQYNDFYLGLLDTGAGGIPADGNISFDALGNPLSVNNGFFDVCTPQGCYACPEGAGELAGTGLQAGNLNPGGGTVWLETTAPIVPGEDMVLEMMIFDVTDDWLNSYILLDGFEWDIDPSGVGTNPQE